ncbi:MAG: molybdopterin molybdotransferase MoeA [Candidatus Alcyoniella australis]|nr:molybdopterin molybdotransferase MoeA [Candidatus Alcyoniella australis]
MPVNRDKKQQMISFARALEIAGDNLPASRSVELPLIEALNLVAARDYLSLERVPPWDNSAMDGFAVRAADTLGATPQNPVELEVDGVLAAGAAPQLAVRAGRALRIMTGAPMPDGADAVAMIEITDGGQSRVRIFQPVSERLHVRYAGEDVEPGALVAAQGDLLGPAELGSLASAGLARAQVWDRPRVALLITGDELVDPGEELPPGKIRNSNATSLRAQVIDAGGVPDYGGAVVDDPAVLLAALERAAESADFVLSTGGVSMGDYDFVADVLQSAGFEPLFAWVAQRPGAPLTCARRDGTLFFGLPGNPASTMVCFELHVRHLLRSFMRHPRPQRRRVAAHFVEPFKKRAGLMHAARVIAQPPADGVGPWTLRPSGSQGSALLRPLVRANALALTPVEPALVTPEHELEALLL